MSHAPASPVGGRVLTARTGWLLALVIAGSFSQTYLRNAFNNGMACVASPALSVAMKEVIALALAVAQQCDGCIAYHARGAVRHGATPGQVAEALGVALLMNGGPATVYGPRAWAAYNEFREG